MSRKDADKVTRRRPLALGHREVITSRCTGTPFIQMLSFYLLLPIMVSVWVEMWRLWRPINAIGKFLNTPNLSTYVKLLCDKMSLAKCALQIHWMDFIFIFVQPPSNLCSAICVIVIVIVIIALHRIKVISKKNFDFDLLWSWLVLLHQNVG